MKKDGFIPDNIEQSELVKRKSLIEILFLRLTRRNPNHFNNLEYNLLLLWEDIIKSFQIDHEYRYVFANMEAAIGSQEPWEDEISEIERAFENAQKWIKNANKVFNNKIKILYSHLNKKDEYSKNYPNPNWSNSYIIKKSKQVALIDKNISMDLLDKIFCEIVQEFWAELISQKILKFIVKTKTDIGYSGGFACNHLLYKVDPASLSFHTYPINKNDISKSHNYYGFSINVLFKHSNETYKYEKKNNLINSYLV